MINTANSIEHKEYTIYGLSGPINFLIFVAINNFINGIIFWRHRVA